MHPTADTAALIISKGAARRVMRSVRRRYNGRALGFEERGWQMTYHASCGFQRELDAA
jgi:hypothetical protein